ncbi:MAG: SDR family oxidoreductase [Bryobacteraceae bacterium]
MPGLLLTGATGYVGGEVALRLLSAMPSWRIFFIARDPERIPPYLTKSHQVTVWKGDITEAHLGLADWQLAILRKTLTEVVHCAAGTRFDQPLDEARLVNTEGTANVLRLAEECPRIVKFLHVSTAWVAGRTEGIVPEALIQHRSPFSSTYQQSKYEAEQIVASYAWRLPTAIARIGIIFGDSRDGHVAQFNFLHQLLSVYPRGTLPKLPYDERARCDLVASDWVFDALAWLFLERFNAGDVYHLCAGEHAMTVGELLAETARVFSLHPWAQRWVPIRTPRLVPLSEYEEFAERTKSEGSMLMSELVRSLGYFVPHLGIHQVFDNRRTLALLEGSGIELPPAREGYGRMVRWCLDTDWGKI